MTRALPSRPSPAGEQTATAPVRANLTDAQGRTVEFDFNPETIKVEHKADTKPLNRSMGKPAESKQDSTIVVGNPSEVIVNAGEATISFGDLIFEGKQVAADCRQLLEWTYPIEDTNTDPPKPPPKGPQIGGHRASKWVKATPSALPPPMVLPLLTFSWNRFDPGTKFLDGADRTKLNLILEKVDATYSRFGSDGVPYRAKVGLTCKIPPAKASKQNPTSGGRPDRRGHVVTAGEDLVGIARQKYGHPGYWRDLAVLNGVDDPLRVRPGDRLYVPGLTELRDGST